MTSATTFEIRRARRRWRLMKEIRNSLAVGKPRRYANKLAREHLEALRSLKRKSGTEQPTPAIESVNREESDVQLNGCEEQNLSGEAAAVGGTPVEC